MQCRKIFIGQPSIKIKRHSKRYYKLDVARTQLKTAIEMFFEGKDRMSIITLSGAAGEILAECVRRAGKEGFVEYAVRVHDSMIGYTPTRESYNKHINTQLGINTLKHHAEAENESFEMDEENAAEQAITKAVSDYVAVNGQEELFIKQFLQWAWHAKGGEKIMEEYNMIDVRLRS